MPRPFLIPTERPTVSNALSLSVLLFFSQNSVPKMKGIITPKSSITGGLE